MNSVEIEEVIEYRWNCPHCGDQSKVYRNPKTMDVALIVYCPYCETEFLGYINNKENNNE